MLETFLLLVLAGASLQETGAGEPAEDARKLKYRGPVVYSNLPPPVLYFPSFPPDPKISSRGDAEEKNIEYVPFPYENLPLLVYQSNDQPPVHVVEKNRDSTQATESKDNVKVQQQSGPAAPEAPKYLKNNQQHQNTQPQQYQNTQPQQYQNTQPQQHQNAPTHPQQSPNTYSPAPELFPNLENQEYVSVGISTYHTDLPNNVLYNVPQPADPSSPPQKQNTVLYPVQNNRQNSQPQPSYTVVQNNAQKHQQPLISYNDNSQPNQYIPNVAVQPQGQNLPYGQSQPNIQRLPDQKPPEQNQYNQIPQQHAPIGYSIQQNYGPKQMPASIQQLLHQQANGDKLNSYQYMGPSVPINSQDSSNYNMQQQGVVQDQPQVQKLQVQLQTSTENVPDDNPDQQFLSIALYPYDIRGNNYKEEPKQFFKIVLPPLDDQQENSYGPQPSNSMEIQGQRYQYYNIDNSGHLAQSGSKQINYPSNPSSIEIAKQQVNIQKPQTLLIQQPAEMQRQYAIKMQQQQSIENQKQREVEMQRQKEMHMRRQHAIEMQKQKEREIQRQKAREIQRQKAMAMDKQKAAETQRERAMEIQKQRAMEAQKQKAIEMQRQQRREKQKQMSQTRGQSEKAYRQKQNTKQEDSREPTEDQDDAIEYQQILIHIPHALAAQPQIVVQEGDIDQAINPYRGRAQIASLKNDTDKLLDTVVTHIRQQSSYSGEKKQPSNTLQNSESFRGPANSNFFKQAEYIKLPTENLAVSEIYRHHYNYVRPRPKPSFRNRHPGAYASSNYHFTTTNPVFLNPPRLRKNTFRSPPSYSFLEPPTLLQSSSHQYHNIFNSYPDELLAEASYQSPTYIPLVKPGQNAMSVLPVSAPQLQTNFPGPIRINAGPSPHSPFGPMPNQMIYGNRNFPPPSSVPAGSGKYGSFIKKLTTLSNIILSQSLGMKSQITPREETKEADEYNVEEVDESTLRDDVQDGTKENNEDSDITVSKDEISKRISNPSEDSPRPPIIVYKGSKPPVEVYGTKDDIEKGKSPLKKASSTKIDRNEEIDLVKTMYSILPKLVKRSITNRNDEEESDLADIDLEEEDPLKEGATIDELEAFVDSDVENDKKDVDSDQSANLKKEPISAVNDDIEELMKLLHKEEASDIFPS